MAKFTEHENHDNTHVSDEQASTISQEDHCRIEVVWQGVSLDRIGGFGGKTLVTVIEA